MRHSTVNPSDQPTYHTDGTKAELEVLDLLQRYDCLPSHYIRIATGSELYTRAVISRLAAGHYIGLPLGRGGRGISKEAREFARKHTVFFPLAIWSRGEALLRKHGKFLERAKDGDHFDHKVARSVVDFSFDFAPRVFNGLRIKPQHEIIAHPDCAAEVRTDPKPQSFKLSDGRRVVPDGPLRGLEYTYGTKTANLFYFLEVDNGTEPGESKDTERQSINRKVENYREFFHRKIFNTRYGLPNMTVFFVFNDARRVETALDIVARKCSPAIAQRFAMKSISNFRTAYPPATAHMVAEPWRRVGESLDIMQTLTATVESKHGREARANSPAHSD
ncbi:MAG: hypothetical protein ACK4UO_13105 [Pseudolabrys sp.]